jgi:hypothetical protein
MGLVSGTQDKFYPPRMEKSRRNKTSQPCEIENCRQGAKATRDRAAEFPRESQDVAEITSVLPARAERWEL